MATEGTETESAGSAHGSSSKSRIVTLILPILNILALLGTIGFFYYSRFLHKRPPITEEAEREKLANLFSKPAAPAVPALVPFEPMTVNISQTPNPARPTHGSAEETQGKPHYITLGFALEIRDGNQKDVIDTYRSQIIDKLIQTLGKKHAYELTNVQGRYILHSQMIDMVNQIIASNETRPSDSHSHRRSESHVTKEALVTNVFFTQFMVQ